MTNYVDLFTTSGSMPLLYGLSFLGGLIASISPCSLAMLPIIIGYVGGYSDAKPAKTFMQLLFFIMGSAIVFSVIGIICAVTGKVFVSFAGGYFSVIIASIVMIMGLKLIGVLDFEMPVLIKEMPKNDGTSTFIYPLEVIAFPYLLEILYMDGEEEKIKLNKENFHIYFPCIKKWIDVNVEDGIYKACQKFGWFKDVQDE